MNRMYLAAILLGALLLMGAMVTAQETASQPTLPQHGMGSMMGMGMMGQGGQMGPMGQMGSMMQVMHGMMQMTDARVQMMGETSPTVQESKK